MGEYSKQTNDIENSPRVPSREVLQSRSFALIVISCVFIYVFLYCIHTYTTAQAFETTLVYHLGTCAYGAFVIPPVTATYFVLSFLVRTCAKSENACLKYAHGLVECMIGCQLKFLRYVSKDAYIMTALYGFGFTKACRRSYFTLMRNHQQISAAKMVSKLVLLLGKVPVCSIYLFLLLSYPMIVKFVFRGIYLIYLVH